MRGGSGDCWRRWRKWASKRPSWWWRPKARRIVVIDGYKRIAALEQLGRDTVEAVVWPMSEAAAVLLDRSLRLSEHETALEVGWLLQELERRFG
jgi:ParB-like chromosome segregation protein Spo0J